VKTFESEASAAFAFLFDQGFTASTEPVQAGSGQAGGAFLTLSVRTLMRVGRSRSSTPARSISAIWSVSLAS
jgi:hypothetical protein